MRREKLLAEIEFMTLKRYKDVAKQLKSIEKSLDALSRTVLPKTVIQMQRKTWRIKKKMCVLRSTLDDGLYGDVAEDEMGKNEDRISVFYASMPPKK